MEENTKKIIEKALKEAKNGLKKYVKIMELFHEKKENISKNKDFQRLFTGFYRIRGNPEFFDGYYTFMYKHRDNVPSFEDTLDYLYRFGRLESSFASKLLATIDPKLPVWDKYILFHFGLGEQKTSTKMDKQERINHANTVYNKLQQGYKNFLTTEESRLWIELFDEHYPEYKDKLTPIKKIDITLWQIRDKNMYSILIPTGK